MVKYKVANCVFQVETIGDAYCVAGGLHRTSTTHAQQIVWMALKMISTCKNHKAHDGQPIRVNRRSGWKDNNWV